MPGLRNVSVSSAGIGSPDTGTYDVAVQQPCARVVDSERDGKPATTGQSSGVSAWRVVKFQFGVRGPDADTSAKHVEVMAVEMNRVRNWNCGAWAFLDNPVRPLS